MGRGEEARGLGTTELRKAFEESQATRAATAVKQSDGAVQTSTDLSRSIATHLRVFFLVGSLPALIALALGSAFVVFLVFLLGLFGRLQTDR